MLLCIFALFIVNSYAIGVDTCQVDMCGLEGTPCLSNENCAPNLHCRNESRLCSAAKVDGEICSTQSDCAVGLRCINHEGSSTRLCRSAKFLGNGDSCKFDYECMGSMVCSNGACSLKGGKCEVHEDCTHSQYCFASEGNCRERIGKGGECKFGRDICAYPQICGAIDNSLDGKCVDMFTKNSGDKCFAQFGECNMTKGYICPSTNGLINSCQPQMQSNMQCSETTVCDRKWMACECELTSDNSTCQSRYYENSQCQDLFQKYRTCIHNSKCAFDLSLGMVLEKVDSHELNMNSCIMKSCPQETSCYYAACLRIEFPCGVPSTLPNCTTVKITHPRVIAGPASHLGNGTIAHRASSAGLTTSPEAAAAKNSSAVQTALKDSSDNKNTGSTLMAPVGVIAIVNKEEEDFVFEECLSQFSSFHGPSQSSLDLKDLQSNVLLQSQDPQYSQMPKLKFDKKVVVDDKGAPEIDFARIKVTNDLEYNIVNVFDMKPPVAMIYKERNITSFYDWQRECLVNKSLLVDRNNLIYSLPTSGGKTLVAEIILLRTVLKYRKKVLFVFPFVSIVVEKTESLTEFSDKLKFPVEAHYGTQGTIPLAPGRGVTVCTIEKANIVINNMIEEDRLSEIGTVIIDELHMVGDGDRGFLLELLIAKILYVSKGAIQVIGMSATMPNLKSMQDWFRGDVFEGNFRPVPLVEHVRCLDRILVKSNDGMSELRKLTPTQGMTNREHDYFMQLINEVVPDCSCLIFCPSIQGTIDNAKIISGYLKAQKSHRFEEREIVVRKLRDASDGSVDENLSATIPFGVAFHNSSLTSGEREIIEQAFKDKVINVLCSTSTLSAGVNLPAQRVILLSTRMGNNPISTRVYKQMCGRAGRAGIDTHGESFLFLNKKDYDSGVAIVTSPLEPVISDKKLVANCIGISRDFIQAMMDGEAIYGAERQAIEIQRHKRFYMAMALSELIQETPLPIVAKKYMIGRGALQATMQSSGSFAWMVVSFCKKMGWWALEGLVNGYVKRLDNGAKQDILPLVEIKGVGPSRARALWNAGYRTVKSIASSEVHSLISAVRSLSVGQEGVAARIIASAKKLLENQAEQLRKQAADLSLSYSSDEFSSPPPPSRTSQTNKKASLNHSKPFVKK
eukprot:gene10899-12704_t